MGNVKNLNYKFNDFFIFYILSLVFYNHFRIDIKYKGQEFNIEL